jgi:hypothetical protein
VGPDTDSLQINLIFIDTEANRKLATGYGYIDEEDLAFAMSHLEQENNEFCNYSNIYSGICLYFCRSKRDLLWRDSKRLGSLLSLRC